MNIFKTLKTLTDTPGPSGYEQDIAAVITELWEPYVDSITTDRVGSLIAVKHGQGAEPRRRLPCRRSRINGVKNTSPEIA